MIQQTVEALADLYESDETAWLETMSELVQKGQLRDLDYHHLQEYLADMATRDRREVANRMATLITHVLKWEYQPDERSRSWRGTIIEQRYELERHTGRGVLRNHAEAVLIDAYAEAVVRAAAETGLLAESFPGECPYSLEQLLSGDLLKD